MNARVWKAGRGALGPLRPLLGAWRHAGRTSLGMVRCERTFSLALGGKFIELRAAWRMPKKTYEEIALFGPDRERRLTFWSFTSDGGQSIGRMSEALDVHPRALCFEAQMPAGLARVLYWPSEDTGFCFAVESKSKSGWSRFLEQHFVPANA